MKHFVLILVAFAHLSCATQNSSATEDSNIKSLIKKNKAVYLEGQTIDEVIDFTSFLETHLISEGVYQVTINSGITFKKCVFNKPVRAFRTLENGNIVLTSFKGNVSFIDCIFKDEVNFRGSSIYGRTDFTASRFNVDANFEELNCHENAFFNQCKFEGETRFHNSFFNHKANFMSSEFYKNASFQNSLFNSELQLSAARFYKHADLTLIDCRGRVLFNYAEFKDRADFGNSRFFQDFDFVSTKSNLTSFDKCRFMGNPKFNKSEVLTSLSLKDSYFLFGTPEMDVSTEKLLH